MRNTIPDLPILGEPLLAEFANTLYADDTRRLDVLEHPSWIAAWFRSAPCAAELFLPTRLGTHDVARLRALRDAVRKLLEHQHGCQAADIEMINAAAKSTSIERCLTLSATGKLEVVTRTDSSGVDAVVASIALHLLDAVGNGTFDLHVMCDRAGCHMYYFRNHHRRRYCNVRCANADRQARYNARRPKPTRQATPNR